MNAWRTVIVESPGKMRLKEGQFAVEVADGWRYIPLEQIRQVLISTEQGSVSLALLTNLASRGVSVLFCDGTHMPACSVVPINRHFESAGHLMDQAGWTVRKKNAVWNQIVRMKIKQQKCLLDRLGKGSVNKLKNFSTQVREGDKSNREAVAAGVYFTALFGNEFTRHAGDELNAALNYGYAILCSAFSRLISLHGYSTALGIHHCSRGNPVNLASDLMEPFRPFVDEIVFQNRDHPFDNGFKKELIGLLYQKCIYDGKKSSIEDAIDAFILNVMHVMEIPRGRLKEVSFVDKR